MVEKYEDYIDLVSPAPVLRNMLIKSSVEKIDDNYKILESEVFSKKLNNLTNFRYSALEHTAMY